MSHEHRSYGWQSAAENESHSYLVPAVAQILLDRFGGRRARIVDLGCGNGYVTSRIARLGFDVIGVDASPDGIELAKQAHPGLHFEVASVYDDDLADKVGERVDAVIALEVAEHLFYPRRLFEQSHRLLRTGGLLVVSTPYHGYLKNLAISLADGWDKHFTVGWDGGHIKFFSKKTMFRLAEEAGFRDLAMRGVGRARWLWKSMIVTGEARS